MASAAVTAFAVVGFAASSATRGSRYTNHVRPTWVGPRSGLEVKPSGLMCGHVGHLMMVV